MSCPIGTDVEQAASILRAGGLVAFPTETVYGLGGDALDPLAVARIFAAKQRPRFDPLIVHVAEPGWLATLVTSVPGTAAALIAACWPGPLTLVLPKTEAVPEIVTAGLSTVAVRMPAHRLALDLLQRTGRPVAAPSANVFGRVSPTTAEHVAEQLGDRIDYILDGGPCAVGLESTVLDLSGPRPVLLRPGGLPRERIEATIGPVETAGESGAAKAVEAEARPSPGLLSRHYATRTPLVVLAADAPLPATERIGLLTFRAEPVPQAVCAVEVLSPRGDLAEAGAGLFAAMRRLDALSLDVIIARPFPDEGLGRAINDRLSRAAHS
jgi:L-threonylcarbamoyladenylate synthase